MKSRVHTLTRTCMQCLYACIHTYIHTYTPTSLHASSYPQGLDAWEDFEERVTTAKLAQDIELRAAVYEVLDTVMEQVTLGYVYKCVYRCV
jgi:hypothetical protein